MEAIIMNPVMEAILSRRSIRAYTGEQVSRRELDTVLEAALWAPTASNRQEISFVVMQDAALLAEFCADYRDFTGAEGLPTRGAPTFILMFGPEDIVYSRCDAGIAAENMQLAAHSIGLGSLMVGIVRVFMESERGEKWAKRLGVQEGKKFQLAFALGHAAKGTEPKPRTEGRVIMA